MKTKLIIAVVILLSCSTQVKKETLPFYSTPDFTPLWLSSNDKEYSSIHTIAPFSFTDQNARTITNQNVEGKICVVNFFFTTCASICPKIMNNLKKVQRAFSNNDIIILSHSVMPETDNVQRLAVYANRFNINYNWHLLTGNKDAIYNVARKSYFADENTGYNKDSNEFLHTENCVLVDGAGRIRGIYNATLRLEMSKLIEHIKILQQED